MKRISFQQVCRLRFALLWVLALLAACSPAQPTALPMPETQVMLTPTVIPENTPTVITEAFPAPTIIPTALPERDPQPSGKVTLMAVGDIMLARTIGDLLLEDGVNKPFMYTANTLRQADITLGNLECAISNRGEAEDKTYTFRAPLNAANELKNASFDLLTLANNHVLDYGREALFDTMDALEEQSIAIVGAGQDALSARQPVILERNGLRIAFLAYLDIPIWNYDYLTWVATPNQAGVAWGYLSDIQTDVQAAAKLSDVVVVLMHFGIEGDNTPSYQQVISAQTAIDAGAKLVIGAHTHVLQPVEKYKDGLIVFNLGNFVFDEFSGTENQSAIFMAHLTAKGVSAYKLIPVKLQENGIPTISR